MHDAIILAGGRSSRLGGEPKAQLRHRGRTLLEHTLGAARHARRVVVVGDAGASVPSPPMLTTSAPDEPAPGAPAPNTPVLTTTVLVTREDPPFQGPAAAIDAGLRMLDEVTGETAGQVLVLACDMPAVDVVVAALLRALADRTRDDRALGVGAERAGVMAVDEQGHPQFLAAIYPTGALRGVLVRHREDGTLPGLSVRKLVARIPVEQISVTPGATADVDTWPDAAAHGIRRPSEDSGHVTPDVAAPSRATEHR